MALFSVTVPKSMQKRPVVLMFIQKSLIHSLFFLLRCVDQCANLLSVGSLKKLRNQSINLAAEKGNLKRVLWLLKSSCCDVNQLNTGFYPLLRAVKKQHLAIVRVLLSSTKSHLCAQAFVEACYLGDVQLVKSIFPYLKSSFDRYVNAGLIRALSEGHEAVINFLMFDSRINPNFSSLSGLGQSDTENSLFVLACEKNNQALVETFLADIRLKLNKAARLGIFAAAQNNHWNLVKFLLSYSEVYVEGRFPVDYEGRPYRLFLVARMKNEFEERTFGLNDTPQNKNFIDLDTVSAGATAQKHLEIEEKIISVVMSMIEKNEMPFNPLQVLIKEPMVMHHFYKINSQPNLV